MTSKRISLGGTGETVRNNLKRLRGGMQYKELAEKLAEVGRPIPTLGLRRIEAGERRVDVDDLMALSVVFDVSPLTILLPQDGSRTLASPMTGVIGREVSHNTQWLFGLGQQQLVIDVMDPNHSDLERAFQLRSVPTVEDRQYDGGVPLEVIEKAIETGETGTLEAASLEGNKKFVRSALIQGLKTDWIEDHGDD